MSYSDDLEAKILNHLFGISSWTAPTGIYASLHTADPGEDGSNEVSGNGYARVSTGIGGTNWTLSGANVISNDNTVTFTGPTPSPWSAVTHFGLWDASTSGNFIGGGALTTSRTPVVDVDMSVAAGDLTATLD